MRHLVACLMLFPAIASAQAMRLPPETARFNHMAARFAPVEIRVDLSGFRPASARRSPASSRPRASRCASSCGDVGRQRGYVVAADGGHDAARSRASRLLPDQSRALVEARRQCDFIPDAPPKPEAANFYPSAPPRPTSKPGSNGLAGADRTAATGFFTTIRRDAGRKFAAVPYSLEYQGELAEMARHLRDAAAATSDRTLKEFLTARADAFASNELSRQRYRLDEARLVRRADDRALRGVRGRLVQLQGRIRGLHHGPRRRRRPRSSRASAASSSGSRTDCRSMRGYRRKQLGGLAPLRVVNVGFPQVTATTMSRPPPSICRTTSASWPRWDRSERC